jgi:hypothetical protein
LSISFGLVLALLSALALNWGWVVQHGAAAALPPLSLRRPRRALHSLFTHRRWLAGFSVGIGGWALYVGALAFAPLSLVQAASAGGIGVLALFASRMGGDRLSRREWAAVGVSIAGLLLLAVSLVGGSGTGHAATWGAIVAWLVGSTVLAAIAAGPGARFVAAGAGLGLAAGVLYAAGDVTTKSAVGGGAFVLLVPVVLAAHGLAFGLLQLGFQRGRALATAGTSSLVTNALPIAAGLVLFHEHVPGGPLGALRIVAFALTVVGASVLARG